jgi:hypothetical protein
MYVAMVLLNDHFQASLDPGEDGVRHPLAGGAGIHVGGIP